MLNFGHFIIRHAISFPVMVTSWFLSVFQFDLGFIVSSLLSIGIYAVSVITIKQFQKYKKLKQYGLSRSEYRHIKQQLKNAKLRMKELNQNYLKVRSISAFKQLFEMNKLAKRIYSIVEKNPRKFYQAESFFYAHLESATELTQKYTLLAAQPIKDHDMQIALQETRETLENLNVTMEEDLRSVLSSDIEKLKMELDFVKVSTNKKQLSFYNEEEQR